jgi:hypothetical protein
MAGLDVGICKFSSPTRIGLQPVSDSSGVAARRGLSLGRRKHYRSFSHLNDAALFVLSVLSVLTLGPLLCRSLC